MKKNILQWIAVVLLILSATQIKGDDLMPRGAPDGNASPYTFASQVVDPGLIYQMLWGFSPIDGQGRIVYLDTFNNTISGWQLGTVGAGQTPVITRPTNGQAFVPPNAVTLNPGVVANDQSAIFRTSFLGVNLRLGLEIGTFIDEAFSANVVIGLDYKPIGQSGGFGAIRFSRPAHAWQYWTGSVWVTFFDIGTINLPAAVNGMQQQIKLIADFSTKKYSRVLIGDRLFDLSNINMADTSIVTDGVILVTVRADSYGAGTAPAYIGYALLTKDEP